MASISGVLGCSAAAVANMGSGVESSTPPGTPKRRRRDSDEENSPVRLLSLPSSPQSPQFTKGPSLVGRVCPLSSPPPLMRQSEGFFPRRFSRQEKPLSSFLRKIVVAYEGGRIVGPAGRFFPIKHLGQGHYSNVYLLQVVEGLPLLVPGVPNNEVVVKMFRYDLFTTKNKRQDSALSGIEKKWIPNVLKQYERFETEGVPVTRIYNKASVWEDGYLVMERVTPLDTLFLWGASGLPEEERALSILTQARALFDYSFRDRSNHPPDLKLDNVGIREDGTVVLLDLREEEEISSDAFSLIARKSLNSFAKGNKEVFKFLCESIKGTELYTRLTEGLDGSGSQLE